MHWDGRPPHELAALQSIFAAGESQTLEFKTSFDKAAVESPVAFADAQGTTICGHLSDALVLYRKHTDNIIDFQTNMLSELEACT